MVWNVEVDFRQAMETEPTPTNCPPERIYIPTEIRERMLTWAHTAVAGHPEITRTIKSLSEKYWWPTLVQDVTRYVNRHAPVGKLLPLPVPQRPWSHLSVDFVTGQILFVTRAEYNR